MVAITVEEKARKIMIEKIKMKGPIELNSTIIGDLKATNTDLAEIVMFFEEGFDVDLSDLKIDDKTTFKDLVEHLDEKGA